MKVDAPQQAINVLKEIIAEQADQPASVRMYFAGVEDIEFIMDAQEYQEFGDMVIQDMNSGFRVIPEKMKDMQSGCGTCSGCH